MFFALIFFRGWVWAMLFVNSCLGSAVLPLLPLLYLLAGFSERQPDVNLNFCTDSLKCAPAAPAAAAEPFPGAHSPPKHSLTLAAKSQGWKIPTSNTDWGDSAGAQETEILGDLSPRSPKCALPLEESLLSLWVGHSWCAAQSPGRCQPWHFLISAFFKARSSNGRFG